MTERPTPKTEPQEPVRCSCAKRRLPTGSMRRAWWEWHPIAGAWWDHDGLFANPNYLSLRGNSFYCERCGDALHADGTRTPDGAAMAALRKHGWNVVRVADPEERLWEVWGSGIVQPDRPSRDPAEAIMAAVQANPLSEPDGG